MKKNLEIYIHIPFCVKKCDYCDFLSASSNEQTMISYVSNLIREIHLSKNTMQNYEVSSIFFGGGTPSILDGKLIKSIMNEIRNNCDIDKNAEITIECNPGTLDETKLKSYRDAGINRLSIGLQSANDGELKAIGRIHTWQQFTDNYELARNSGFENINIDIMSALPHQTIQSYKETLDKVLSLKPEHISAYSLIVEEGTPLYTKVKTTPEILPKEDDEREMYYLTKRMLADEGYFRYEISNYSKPGYECQHNIGYWKRTDYLGIGIGSASLIDEVRYNNTRNIKDYMIFNELSEIRTNIEALTKEEQMEEFMFLGLRMMSGISKELFEEGFQIKYEEIYGKITEKLVSEGLLEQTRSLDRTWNRLK